MTYITIPHKLFFAIATRDFIAKHCIETTQVFHIKNQNEANFQTCSRKFVTLTDWYCTQKKRFFAIDHISRPDCLDTETELPASMKLALKKLRVEYQNEIDFYYVVWKKVVLQ